MPIMKLLGWLDRLRESGRESDEEIDKGIRKGSCDRDGNGKLFGEPSANEKHLEDNKEERWSCPLAHPSAKQSRIYFQAQYFVRYEEMRDGEMKQMSHPFKNEAEAIARCEEVNGDLFEKSTTTIGNEYFNMPDGKGEFYFNAYSDPFSYTVNCTGMCKIQEEWAKITDIDFASLYQLKTRRSE